MSNKINATCAYSIGLLYLAMFSNGTCTIISEEQIKMFEKCINDNLANIPERKNFFSSNIEDAREKIYYTFKDKEGNTFYALKPSIDLLTAKLWYIGGAKIGELLASQQENALRCLDLIKVNGEIKMRSIMPTLNYQ